MGEPIEVGFFIQIRERGAYSDSERDWLHETSPVFLEYETWDAAHADLGNQMKSYFQDEEEDQNYTIKKTYFPQEGGGFWWKTPTGREGRTSIRQILKA